MSEFAATLRSRVRRIREALMRAWDSDDELEAAAQYDDLQDMARIADDHGIDVTDPGESERPAATGSRPSPDRPQRQG